jgi:hypothetical protein
MVRNLCLQLLHRLAAVRGRLLMLQDFPEGLAVPPVERGRLTKDMMVSLEVGLLLMERAAAAALEVWVLLEQVLLGEMADLEFLQILPDLA